jgi:hypothetical protein
MRWQMPLQITAVMQQTTVLDDIAFATKQNEVAWILDSSARDAVAAEDQVVHVNISCEVETRLHTVLKRICNQIV